ncbi:MAG: ADP-forming succinate--CoA ligase subunit beta [Planctomycetes bacterium]|uniref:ADP-forming succinate--CoA ligase subunit beta n=1 Tax=Candidatus Wunengus sp. YC65 TaxID=3367701 RepID=UPI001D961A10|nr:ADP-forming succinate--CoA ligase subunit beta [Planctomycetota bacterium]
MKLYEFQAKDILRKCGVCVPRGKAISHSHDASKIFQEIGVNRCVVKAQILAGGRGKGGGIRFANTPAEAQSCAAGMLGTHLVTRQTSQKGIEIKYVLIEEAVSIKKELYLAITIDRSLQTPMLITSAEGGMEIEEVAKKSPDSIIKEPLDIFFGVHPFQARRIASKLGISGISSARLNNLITNLFSAFVNNDCSLLEINPLAVTVDDELCALDAKMDIDDNALYRHQEFEQMSQYQDLSPVEVLAKKYKLSYISLDGNIGCLVNGAGLAMATMDIIKLHGGEPANFLDVGGDASLEQVTQAFKIILSDSKVKAILINIFGGIMKCDVIASGIIQAIKEVGIHIPLVVRLEGTNVDIAKNILSNSGLSIISAKDMKEAASLVVKASK